MTGDDPTRELPFGGDVSGPLPPSIYKGKPPVGVSGFTAKAGSRAIEPVSGSLRQRVLDHLVTCGATGSTDNEGSAAMRLLVTVYGPRRRELTKLGRVAYAGFTRNTITGISQKVWKAIPSRGEQ